MSAYGIIPLGATRRDMFTYDGPAGLVRGQLARIPLGPRQAVGIVAGPASPLDGAKRLTPQATRLPEPAVDLALWTATTYRTPAGSAARLLLPTWLDVGRLPTTTLPPSTPAEDASSPTLMVGFRRAERYRRLVTGVSHFLLLVPEIALAESLVDLERATGAVRFHSGLTVARRRKIWHGVASGTITRVIGTRAALWLPWPTLELVILDEEDDRSYKADRAPRFQARGVAVKLAGLHGARLVLASAAPSLESWAHAAARDWHRELLPTGFPELSVMPTDAKAGSLVAGSLAALAEQRSLIWAPQAAWGRLERAITTAYPSLPVIRPGGNFGSRLQVERFRALPAGVMLGSTALTHPWDFAASQVVVTGLDGLLQLPDFRAAERAHAILRKLAGHASDRLLIHTDHPDHPAIARLGRDPAPFYDHELSERKLLKLPPTQRLSRLEFKQSDPATVSSATAQIIQAGLEVRALPDADPPALLVIGDPSRLSNPLPVGWVLDVDTQRAS